MTAVAVVVFLGTKFLAGAWVVTLAIPLMILLFWRTEGYYDEALATPGHAVGHFALIADGACFTGDAVLGEGSVFISPSRGAMAGYLRALTRLGLRDDFSVLCPGHGPPVWDPHAKLEEYVDHRIDRENKLIAALGRGRRTVPQLLDAVWSDVPQPLRGLATVTLAAHLDKLADERVLPPGVERPSFERFAIRYGEAQELMCPVGDIAGRRVRQIEHQRLLGVLRSGFCKPQF